MRPLLTILFLFIASISQAQDLKSLFIAMPDSLLPLLTKVNRQDFGDFLQSGMKAQVKNRFGKTSEMLTMTEDYLELQLTSVSKVEMKLLPVNDSTQVICVAKTYNGPVADTHLAFYTTEWQELNAGKYIQFPKSDDFYIEPILPEKKDSLEHLKPYADVNFRKAQLSKEERTVRFFYTVPDYMEQKTAEALRTYLRTTPICYQWSEGRFVVKQK